MTTQRKSCDVFYGGQFEMADRGQLRWILQLKEDTVSNYIFFRKILDPGQFITGLEKTKTMF